MLVSQLVRRATAATSSWPPIAVPDSLEEKDIPDYFLCPITGCLMRQPAMTPDVTYDHTDRRVAAEQADRPVDQQPLTIDQLCPNGTVRSMIEDFIAKGPDFIKPSWALRPRAAPQAAPAPPPARPVPIPLPPLPLRRLSPHLPLSRRLLPLSPLRRSSIDRPCNIRTTW